MRLFFGKKKEQKKSAPPPQQVRTLSVCYETSYIVAFCGFIRSSYEIQN